MAITDVNQNGTLLEAVSASTEEDQILLKRIEQGEADAFWTLWERYRSIMLFPNCLRWMGGNYADAEDALNSASVRALEYLCSHEIKINDIKAWLNRLLYNHCMNMMRHQKCELKYLYSGISMNKVTAAKSDAMQMSVEDAAILNERNIYIRRSIDALPLRLRTPVILYYYGGVPSRDIAVCLKVSPANLRKRLEQARCLMRAELAKYLRGETGPVWQEAQVDISSRSLLTAAQEECARVRHGVEEITSRVVAIRTVRVSYPDGPERHLPLALDVKPMRQQQKVKGLRAYVQRHPTGWRKRLQLADLLYTMGEWEDAIFEYRQVLNRQPNHLLAKIRLGQMLHALDRAEEAVPVYQSALREPVADGAKHYVKGSIELLNRSFDRAAQSFAAATRVMPQNPEYGNALGLTHLQANQPIEAMQAFENVLKHHPNDLVALTHSYGPLMTVGREAEAHERMKRTLKIDDKHILALTRLADSYSGMRWGQRDRLDHTKTLLQRAQQIAPENPDVQASQAYFHMAQGEWDIGLAVMREFTRQYPRCPEGWYHYARWCFHTSQTDNAVVAILQAYALAPYDVTINKSACLMLCTDGRGDNARRLLDEMLERFPNDWSVWASAGRILAQFFLESRQACSTSARASTLQPHLSRAWFKYGSVLALSGNLQEAAEAFEHGWRILPTDVSNTILAPAALQLGELYHSLGARAKSKEWWSTAARCAHALSRIAPATGFYWQGKALSRMVEKVS